MHPLNINIPLDTVNAAIQALFKMPYEFAAPHIQLLQARAQEAVQAYEAAQQAAAEAKSEPQA